MSADLAARRAAAASVLADYNRELRTAPLSRPPGREWMLRLATELESLLTALDDGDAVSEDAGKLAAIRAVLAAFDWEHDERQYALEEIERIAAGGDR